MTDPAQLTAAAWDDLLAAHPQGGHSGPFMRHAYLRALHDSGSAVPETGWCPQWLTLWQADTLCAAAPLYEKHHSYGEYVFDWAWADAYARHGLAYYPKGLVAVPFTPVPGPRLLARDAHARTALMQALQAHAQAQDWSSLHLLFAADADRSCSLDHGLLMRQTVQFHWQNAGYADFDAFLAALNQDKRKKIRQERRKVAEAGVRFEARRGADITPDDWAFFYRCYTRTYLEHGNRPYLQPGFFDAMAQTLAPYWVLFVAYRGDTPMACSLVALSDAGPQPQVAYGRYWGALERVDCLHFEACYYQPLAWCMAHGVQRFEGGAQGEHKMARALLPVSTHSAHWLAHPAFADAVARYLDREGEGVDQYLAHLADRTPLRQSA